MSHLGSNAFILLAISMSFGRVQGSFGPGEAAARSSPQPARNRAVRHADFKVAFWYRKNDSLGTFKYQIYDVRKGEYTAKVDEWAKGVETNYSGYYVTVRDVDLTREKGDTDLLKVGAVIDRELTIAAGLAGIVYPAGRQSAHDPFFGLGAGPNSSTSRVRPLNPSAAGDRSYLTPSATSFPVPVPFPRLPR